MTSRGSFGISSGAPPDPLRGRNFNFESIDSGDDEMCGGFRVGKEGRGYPRRFSNWLSGTTDFPQTQMYFRLIRNQESESLGNRRGHIDPEIFFKKNVFLFKLRLYEASVAKEASNKMSRGM